MLAMIIVSWTRFECPFMWLTTVDDLRTLFKLPSFFTTGAMSSDLLTPRRDATPTATFASSLPQKRAFDDDLHAPAISSPLNPDFKPSKKDQQHTPREEGTPSMPARSGPGRPKKDAKKRETKGAQAGYALGDDSSRVSPDPNEKPVPPSEASPARYKVPPPKPSDFEPPRPPQLSFQHEIEIDGKTIEFYDNSEQCVLQEGH